MDLEYSIIRREVSPMKDTFEMISMMGGDGLPHIQGSLEMDYMTAMEYTPKTIFITKVSFKKPNKVAKGFASKESR